jgi:glyoxylase-like metal-dependent hydrolase (beta-lactamase superfamily II)
VKPLAPGLGYVDLQFLGFPHVIATAVLSHAGGVALVDPGPSSTWPTLKKTLADAGLGIGDVRTILLTHIHLDHAGATGTIVGENPAIEVCVHERGAPHMIAPEKLLASATRLYGADMDRLWGRFDPVPSRNIRVLSGGEQLDVAGRRLEVAYTPGHASHHVSYLDRDTRLAFVGDTGGIRRPDGYIIPPTPPPDIDLEVWRDSIARLRAWKPAELFVTHFGPWREPDAHFDALLTALAHVGDVVRASLEEPGSDEAHARAFQEQMERELVRAVPDANRPSYEAAGRFDLSWAGLARYWRKKP